MPIEAESPEELGYDSILYNLAESSVRDRKFFELGFDPSQVLLAYGDHKGHPELRSLVARENDVLPHHVITAPGASAALFIVAAGILNAGDEIAVMHPNYMTNVATPRILGCKLNHISVDPSRPDNFHAEAILRAITTETKLLSITLPHNPTGFNLSKADLEQIIAHTAKLGLPLLVDETYRSLAIEDSLPPSASLSEHVISVSSMSKAYGIPGIRMGWLCTQNNHVIERLLAVKEQIFITSSLLDEHVAAHVLKKKNEVLPPILDHVRCNLELCRLHMEKSSALKWHLPSGGCVGLVQIIESESYNLERFYDLLYRKFSTYVGPGHWFELNDSYFRLGYGYPESEALMKGLQHIELALEECRL